MKIKISFFVCFAIIMWISGLSNLPSDAFQKEKPMPTEYPLIPVSGADGVFETTKVDGVELRRGSSDATGLFPLYLYLRLPENAPKFKQPVYVEIVYRDRGQGRLGLQYNAAAGENYRSAEIGYGRLLTSADKTRTAVFQLAAPDFRRAQNLQCDLRLANPD